MANKDKLLEIQRLVNELLGVDPNDIPLEYSGPDEDGTILLNKGPKDLRVLTHLLIPDVGKDRLTPKQLASVMTNVGCTEDGELAPVGPGDKFFNDFSPFVKKVEEVRGFLGSVSYRPSKEGWVDAPFRVLACRHKTWAELDAFVQTVGPVVGFHTKSL